MLSIEHPPDPSCSKLLAVKADERASESIALQEADPVVIEETPAPNFCIRDYVAASRSKCIEASWPFAQQSLKLCLKHGINDILPPFEPSGLVRGHCLGKIAEIEQPASCSAAEQTIPNIELLELRDIGSFNGPGSIRVESCMPLEEVNQEALDPDSRSSLNDWKSTVEQGTSLDEPIHSSPSEIADTEPNDKPQNSIRLSEKKCRLVAKSGTISEASRADDLVSNSSTVSDPMASKTCPVCKTFSSTSNTTLNAHIDQCLSMESNTKKVSSKYPKVKVKPRKKRLMVDIYATAPHCTLEDLDRRNGTNWATELKMLVAPNSEIATDSKRPKLTSNEAKDDETDESVYVDSNGIKLRILSKFSDTPLQSEELKLRKTPLQSEELKLRKTPLQSEELKLRKHEKDSKVSKSILIIKRKHSAPKYLRNLKMKAQKLKVCSFKPFKYQIQATPQGDYQASEKSSSHISDAQNQPQKGSLSILRHWVCSKRSDVLQKPPNEDTHGNMTNMVTDSANILMKNSQMDPCKSSFQRRWHKKFSRSTSSLLKTKRVDSLCSSVQSIADGKRKSLGPSIPSSRWCAESSSLVNGLLRKLSRSSRNLRSSSKDILEIDKDIHCMSDNACDMSGRPFRSSISLMSDQTNFPLNTNESDRIGYMDLEQRQLEESERPAHSKKFRRHRSNLRAPRRGTVIQASCEGEAPGPTKDLELDVLKKDNALGSCQSAQLMAVTNTRSDAGEYEKIEYLEPTKEQKHYHQKQLPQGSESEEQIIEAMDMPAEILESGNCSYGPSNEPAVSKDIVDDVVNEENLRKSSDIIQDPNICIEEHAHFRSRSKAHVEPWKQKSDETNIHNVDISCDDISNEYTQMVDEVKVGGPKDCCINQLAEYHADKRASAQESDGCLTNHGKLGLEVPHMTSSITVVNVTANHIKTLASDRELSVSPISTPSTVSLPSPKGTDSKDSDAELLRSLVTIEDKLCVSASYKESNGASETINSHGRNQEVKGNLLQIEPERTLDDKPFCCSCRESLSEESQLSRESATTKLATGKQVSNLIIAPRVSSSFSAYQNRITPTHLEHPYHSGSMMNSHDASMKYPVCADLGSPRTSSQSHYPSTSSPILRLMGKNLMVVNNEEVMPRQTSASEYSPSVHICPGFASTNNLLQQESIPYHHHRHHHPYHYLHHHQQHHIFSGSPASSAEAILIGHHQTPLRLPVPPLDGFARPPFRSDWVSKPGQYTQQKRSSERLDSSSASFMLNEVIVIDDSPEHETELKGLLGNPTSTSPLTSSGFSPLPQRSLSCFPVPSQLPEVTGVQRPLFQNFNPEIHASIVHQSSISEGQGPFLRNQFMFQSPLPGQMRPTMYYSHTFR